MRSRTGRIQKGLLLAGGLILGIVIAELVLRLAGIGYPLPYTPDPHCGTRLRPGFAAWFSEEGRAFVSVNSDGNRDLERSVSKPANTFRIAVLGDSYAEAVHVSVEQTFWAVVERELNSCKELEGKSVEVLNFGVSGYGTAQELQMLRHNVWKYEPDLVLLAFTSGNDVRDNSKTLSGQLSRPYFVLGNDGELVLDDSFLKSPDYLKANSAFTKVKVWFINRSRILQVLAEYRANRAERTVESLQAEAASKHSLSYHPGEVGLDNAVYLEPTEPAWIKAWHLTERLIETMHSETLQHGARFWIVTLTNGIQVHPDATERAAFAQRLQVPDLNYPEHRLENLARRLNIPAVLLAPRMQALATKRKLYLHGFNNTRLGDGHWNLDGHRAAGEIIAADICAELGRHRVSINQ